MRRMQQPRYLLLGAVGLAIAARACGGKLDIYPSGSLDDAGVYRAPDGAVRFSPGSFCATYDPGKYVTLVAAAPSCDGGDDVTDPFGHVYSPMCRAWAEQNGLCGAFYACYATCDGRCRLPNRPSWPDYNPPNRCEPGTSGDAYCNALFAEFILPESGKSPLYECLTTTLDGQQIGECGPTTWTECNFPVVVFPDGGTIFDPSGVVDVDASGAIAGYVPGVSARAADGGIIPCEPVCTP